MSRRTGRVVAALAAALALACARGTADVIAGAGGDVGVQLAVGNATVVSQVWIHLSGTPLAGGAYDRWFEVRSDPSGAYSAKLAAVPVGSYFLTGRAFSTPPADPAAGTPDYETAAPVPVTVGRGMNPQVVLVLQQRTPPLTSNNHGPVVDSLVLSARALDPGSAQPLSLAATAHDPDPGDVLTYAWTAAGLPPVAGTFSSPAAPSTTWTPADPAYAGTVTFTFSATDPLGVKASVSAAVSVSPANARGSVDVPLVINSHPDIGAIAVSNAQPAPGAQVDVSVTASDADGDALRYAWTDGCGGQFGDAAARATTWRAPAAPAAGPCTLTVTVRDARANGTLLGGEVTGTLSVNVADPVDVFAPEFRFGMQGPANPVLPGADVFFRIEASEFAAGGGMVPVTDLAWSGGASGDPQPWPVNPAYVIWTAPACGAATAPLSAPVTVTATGSRGATATFEFLVVVQCGP